MLERLDIKTYTIKFPDKIIFTPQTYLWLDEFVRLSLFRGQETDTRHHGEDGPTTDDVRWRHHQIRSRSGR
jgi:succinate dehydrogenase/fumarate reductase flavoprotein subunit